MKNQNKTEKLRKAILKAIMYISVFIGMFMYGGYYSEAANLAQNAANWFIEQFFWIGFIAVIVALATCLVKKAWVQALIVVVAGSVILFLIKSPDVFKSIGDYLGNLVVNGQ